MKTRYLYDVDTWTCWCCGKEFRTDWKRFNIHLEKCECEKLGKERFPEEDEL